MPPERELIQEIQALFAEKLMLEVPAPDQNLLESGALDSLRLVELLFSLEQHFGIRIAMEELDTEDLRSIESIAQFVMRQQVPAHALHA
jgi:acyl carrier protein